MPDFIGGDPESNASECPAVFVIPETGDFVFRGKTITDPALITKLNEHIGKAEDESDVWLPARMAPLIRDALDGYEQGRQGPGQHTFAELLAATDTSVIRFEMRDSYEETEPGFAEWKATGDIGAYDWGDHLDVILQVQHRDQRVPQNPHVLREKDPDHHPSKRANNRLSQSLARTPHRPPLSSGFAG